MDSQHRTTFTTDAQAHGIEMPCHCAICGRPLEPGDVVAVDVVEREEYGTAADVLGFDAETLAALFVEHGMDADNAQRIAAKQATAPSTFRVIHRVALCTDCAPQAAHD